jgi:transcriptional regulator of arginine metabolism
MQDVTKKERQAKIVEIVRAKQIVNQAQLLRALRRLGVRATQSSVSRDLAELGVVKVDGVYRQPRIRLGESPLIDLLDMNPAGDSLIIIKTGSGQASMIAEVIDKTKLPEIVGTLAGDNTIFVAVNGSTEQGKVMKQILALFNTGPRR